MKINNMFINVDISANIELIININLAVNAKIRSYI